MINPSNVERYLRTTATKIIDTLLQSYPDLAIAPTTLLTGRASNPAAIVALGDPRLGNRQLLLTPLSVAYDQSIPRDLPAYITRPTITREQERERIQNAVQAARMRRP